MGVPTRVTQPYCAAIDNCATCSGSASNSDSRDWRQTEQITFAKTLIGPRASGIGLRQEETLAANHRSFVPVVTAAIDLQDSIAVATQVRIVLAVERDDASSLASSIANDVTNLELRFRTARFLPKYPSHLRAASGYALATRLFLSSCHTFLYRARLRLSCNSRSYCLRASSASDGPLGAFSGLTLTSLFTTLKPSAFKAIRRAVRYHSYAWQNHCERE